jgi:hypothetical protein
MQTTVKCTKLTDYDAIQAIVESNENEFFAEDAEANTLEEAIVNCAFGPAEFRRWLNSKGYTATLRVIAEYLLIVEANYEDDVCGEIDEWFEDHRPENISDEEWQTILYECEDYGVEQLGHTDMARMIRDYPEQIINVIDHVREEFGCDPDDWDERQRITDKYGSCTPRERLP